MIKDSGDLSTTWYNYTLASAGSIIDENTTESSPATNMDTATESLCPNGWTIPNTAQILSIGNNSATYIPDYLPVLGGDYYNGALASEFTRGGWWGSEGYSGIGRYTLFYNGSTIYRGGNPRRDGLYIRCVQKS